MEGPRDLKDRLDLEDLAFMDNDPFAAFNCNFRTEDTKPQLTTPIPSRLHWSKLKTSNSAIRRTQRWSTKTFAGSRSPLFTVLRSMQFLLKVEVYRKK